MLSNNFFAVIVAILMIFLPFWANFDHYSSSSITVRWLQEQAVTAAAAAAAVAAASAAATTGTPYTVYCMVQSRYAWSCR